MENSSEEKTEGIPQREEKILRFWKEKRIFESSLLQNEGKEAYVFYDGPPFATGLPHYGHLLQGTIKDVIPRYQTMRGRFVRREWGWDCHGLPLENLIEKELGIKQKSEIEEYGIENFNQKARESVMLYDSEWKSIVPRMGRWVDMERSYKTMDASYTESIWWSFKNLYDKKLIYEGYKSMHICPRCETTLAMSEVGMNYKDIKDISVYVEFELADELGTFLIAWTTTPWTLPSNLALAVGKEIDYVKVKEHSSGRFYILTAGEGEFQKQKLLYSGVLSLIPNEQIIIVGSDKKESLRLVCGLHPKESIIFADDKEINIQDAQSLGIPNLFAVQYDERGFEKLNEAVSLYSEQSKEVRLPPSLPMR
jgi:isoleucyl-tRNA synthetase